jgi:hypothetical protein
MPPALINDTLTWIFSGEHKSVLQRLDGGPRSFRHGVSFIALLEKTS